MIVVRNTGEAEWAFCARDDLTEVATRGPVTPDHVIWTKRTPMLGRDVAAFAAAYRTYFEDNAGGRELTMLDPAPRIVLDPELGMLSVGTDVKSARGAAELYRHTISVIEQATGLGGYRPPSARDIFDLEYWELEQSKLDRADDGKLFTGEVALVTGAASGIGRACAADLLAHGAAVIGLDISESVTSTFGDDPAFLGVTTDVTHPDQVSDAIDAGVAAYGGLDMVVAAAGLFPESAPIAKHDPVAWRKAMSVNVDGFVELLSMVHPLLAKAPRYGRVAVIGSKNIAAPGPGASAYSASKAAANQIARVAALEWAADGIRVNSVHPDAIFDTGLWTPELLAARAARYGMSIEEYKRRNLLKTEIPAAFVGMVVSALLGPTFEHITGAHIPIDGGNDRVI
jgi:NAD(P)-dependent dehydrogenase (short-subunit alcohol dehydrogenase family)